MKKYISTVLLLFVLFHCFGQKQRKVSAYISPQFSRTLHDRTEANSPHGFGAGLQFFFHNITKFKPLAEVTADAFGGGVRLLMLDSTGFPLAPVESMINVFGGASFHPFKNMYVSIVGGPSFINGETLFGLKPSVGFYFTKRQIVMARISYVNVPERLENKDFGVMVLSVGVKLF